MSTCISRHGEYSSHEYGSLTETSTTEERFTCRLCGVLDEAALLAEVERLTAERDAVRGAKEHAVAKTLARAETAEANLAASMEAHAVTAGEVARLREDVGAVVIGLNWERATRPDSQQSIEWLNLTLDRVVGHLRALLGGDQ